MEFYSPGQDLKETFGLEINDAEYISEVNKICKNAGVIYQEARFLPHNLLTNWNDLVKGELSGDEHTEDFHFDFCRDILFIIENNKSLIRFSDHKVFLEILKMIDNKFKTQTFIPPELQNEKRWWNCSVFKRGTQEYINQIEQDIFDKFKLHLNLKNQVEHI